MYLLIKEVGMEVRKCNNFTFFRAFATTMLPKKNP
jgi:hypothetical protein